MLYLSRHEYRHELVRLPANRILYALCSVAGTMLVHQGLDGIAKYYNYKVGEDRFNFENESFQQSEDLVANDYSVNIPMIYYWKQKMHKGWINIINPFRGTIVLGTRVQVSPSASSIPSSVSTLPRVLYDGV